MFQVFLEFLQGQHEQIARILSVPSLNKDVLGIKPLKHVYPLYFALIRAAVLQGNMVNPDGNNRYVTSKAIHTNADPTL